MWGWVFFPINHVKDKQSVSLFLLEISVVFQEPAFLLSNTFTDFSNTLIPFLCRTYSVTGHTNTLLIPRGWIQAWRKSVHVPGDQQRDISLHWATIWPILSDVFGQQLRSSWLLYVSTKGVEKSFWYGYLVKEIKRFPFALILFMFSVYKLNFKNLILQVFRRMVSEIIRGIHATGATAKGKWQRFMKWRRMWSKKSPTHGARTGRHSGDRLLAYRWPTRALLRSSVSIALMQLPP